MGGKPKTTDLLLDTVTAALKGDKTELARLVGLIRDKHSVCANDLLPPTEVRPRTLPSRPTFHPSRLSTVPCESEK
jgi:hypothetical protein